ncbi:MAG: type-F conjugative transfer system pilin assembly protein TrbC [Sphingomonas sp.]|uniref:type-F conjugative transfer system pilin assembly protein TrbC n=1 Tax=Sphingomonas sp. TaxID=28214 RepID=UPI00262EBC25|nr:type-F conjugative transfer system pilin assembly protein TrbC [Sphingomonas sp.]MDK2768439.1 type-F conjugative transfer system pilin assembly protein TrbC [Sphingomonas sp.]
MRISTQSVNSMTACVLILLASAALAQNSASERIEREGGPAMQRLEQALKQARPAETDAATPRLPPDPPPDLRRRAFQGLQKHRPSADLVRRASEAAAAGQAQLAAQREAMGKRLRQSLGLEPGELEEIAKAVAPVPTGWVPVLFVSSSIPVPVLRSYAAQLERVRGVMAFRGVPGGLRKLGPMARLTARVLRIDPGCEGPSCVMRDVQIIIDPLVFRQHGVAHVPALAMIPGDPTQPYCEREDESPRANIVIYGDAALSGLIDEYRRLGGTKEVENVQARLAAP